MSRLNPLSAEDRRITAYTNTFFIKDWELGTVRAGIDSFDCWGRQQGGTYKFTTTAEYLARQEGFRNYVTLDLMKRGCCPVIAQELAEMEAGIPTDMGDGLREATEMHETGYGIGAL